MKPKKIIWKFTNQRELTALQFIDYFERKIFRTIRKYNMLPKDRKIRLEKAGLLNTILLKHVLEKKFSVVFSSKANMFSNNLSGVAEDCFKDVLNGKFKVSKIRANPLCNLSDKEIELYARLVGLKGVKRRPDKKIKSLFDKFVDKNPDLEHNIVNAVSQL